MKKLFKSLGFRRPDEMERSILFRAQRNAYIFLVAALFLLSIYESCKVYVSHSRLNPLPSLLLLAAALIQSFSQAIMTRNAVKDDEDSNETGPLFKLIVLVCVTLSAAASIAAIVIWMGVRL